MVAFLCATDPDELSQFALKLEMWNNERKLQCDQVFKAALQKLKSNRSLENDPILILDDPNWPAGVVGIVASRLVELYHRPCILLVTPPGELARGSARSIEGINITRAIAAQKELLEGFGGHPMAAGLSLKPERLAEFHKSIIQFTRKLKVDTSRPAPVRIDVYVPLQDINLELVESISILAPFGAGNPPLTLAAENLTLKSKNPIGKQREHLKLMVEDSSGTSKEVIWWQGVGNPLPEGKFNLAYTVRTSDFKGSPHPQMEWMDYQDIPEPSASVTEIPLNLDWVDYRSIAPPNDKWGQILAGKPAIWGEGRVPPELNAVDRLNLQPAPVLIIWAVPPGPQEFKQALDAVRPDQVILLGNITANDLPLDFLKELGGMALFAIHKKEGWFDIPLAAARSGQRFAAVSLGIKCLCARGLLKQLHQPTPDRIQLAQPGVLDSKLESLETELKIILRETGAYRQSYLRSRADLIISAAQKYMST